MATNERRASVILFKESGKYYTGESWRVPAGAIGPWDMEKSLDFHRIGTGLVLVTSEALNEYPEDDNWGFPQLL